MEKAFEKLAQYGPLFLEKRHNRWWVACKVKLESGDFDEIVKTSDFFLEKALCELLSLSAAKKRELLSKQEEPCQASFNYGATNRKWNEIV